MVRMNSAMRSSGNSNNEQDDSYSGNGRKTCHRHTPHQIQTLEEFFKDCPHPDDNQRRQLGKELGLEPKQIKFWFQNKRTQVKTQTERADNSALRAENERILCENLAIKESLKNVICPSCGGPPFGEDERRHCLQMLKLENARLKQEHEKVSHLLTQHIRGANLQNDFLKSSVSNLLAADSRTQEMESIAPYYEYDQTNNDNISSAYQYEGVTDTERAAMCDVAANAMDELLKLVRTNEPLWEKSPSDGRYVIQRENYDKTFPKAAHVKSPAARIESSKDSTVATINAAQLVDVFLDADKWVDFFPSIVTKAKIIQVLEERMVGNRSGSLQLMYEQMHVLSPFVAPREFCFLRHCRQIENGLWVVVDVSYAFLKETTHTWKLPSGCMIQDLPTGCSKVTWVEHVEVDQGIHTHHLYRDLICGNLAYGSERWVISLQKMCERFSILNGETARIQDFGGVITQGESRRSIMKLAHRMVKSFYSMLNMPEELNLHDQLPKLNKNGFRVSVRQSIESSQPNGMIVSAATSIWLPKSPQNVFSFLKDVDLRVQWDVLCNGNAVNEIANISTGNGVGNCISIIKPVVSYENIMMVQETSCDECLGGMIVYSPVSVPAMSLLTNCEDSCSIPLLPSGFIISTDAPSTGTLLTVAFQILACSLSLSNHLHMDPVATMNNLLSSTVERIKALLNCSASDATYH